MKHGVTGYVMCGTGENVRNVLVGKPEGKRLLVRPRNEWADAKGKLLDLVHAF
jgi:hypothetical protein